MGISALGINFCKGERDMRQYIGARYVPMFFENSATGDSTWASNTPYEPLTIVTWNNFSYTSKKKVPATVGAPNLNTEYWVLTGDYTGAIGDISQRLDAAEGDIDDLETDVGVLEDKDKFFLYPTGTTADRSADIIAKLTAYGVCYFATGDFYVAQEIVMPDNSSLIGMGSGTKLRLNYNGNLINMGNNCTVSKMLLLGYATDYNYPIADKGNRVGIYVDGDAVDFEHSQTIFGSFNLVSDVFIKNFDGSGIKCNRTGGAMPAVNVENCHIVNCYTAIDIPAFSEFNSFTNVSVRHCVEGVILQAGNNGFNNCKFIGCVTMVKISDPDSTLINPDHSLFVGCIFAHTGTSNNGKLMDINGCRYGLIFSGCTFGYGEIDVRNSVGININNCMLFMTGQNFKFVNCTRIDINNNNFGTTMPSWNFSGTQWSFVDNMYNNLVIDMTYNGAYSSINGPGSIVYNKNNAINQLSTREVGVANQSGYIFFDLHYPKEMPSTTYDLTINSIGIMGIGDQDVSNVTIITKGKSYAWIKLAYAAATTLHAAYEIHLNYSIANIQ